MSRKKIEQIPSQIVSKETHRVNFRKTLIHNKFSWLAKYLRDNQQDTDNQSYLTTSIKMYPKNRNNCTLSHNLKENRQILNKSKDTIQSTNHEAKATL